MRSEREIAALLQAAYGEALNVATVTGALAAVARAFDVGDLARASIAALHLRLPPLVDDTAIQELAATDQLLKAGFNPYEPRDAHGR